MKHVWFLTIMHITTLRQTIATSQHIWLLTWKLIKKTAHVTTHRAVKYQICRHSISLILSATEMWYFSFVKKQMCNMSGLVNVNFPYFMVYEYNILMTYASWCSEFIGDKNGKSTVCQHIWFLHGGLQLHECFGLVATHAFVTVNVAFHNDSLLCLRPIGWRH